MVERFIPADSGHHDPLSFRKARIVYDGIVVEHPI